MKIVNRNMKLILALILCSNSLLNAAQDLDIPDHFYEYAKDFPGHVIYRGNVDDQALALTFDDGPSEITGAILDLLKKHEILSTFFWQGKNLRQYPEIVARAIEEGHELGNHSWNHPNCAELSPSEMWTSQVNPTEVTYDSLYQLNVRLYRPPFGAVTGAQLHFLAKKDIKTILWSLSTYDWDPERNSAQEIAEWFKQGLHPGAIVLLHDMDFERSAAEKLEGIDRIITYAKAEGYTFLTVSEIANTK